MPSSLLIKPITSQGTENAAEVPAADVVNHAKIQVLLADDHAIMRDGIRALLSIESDIEIVGEAREGREAIEKAGILSPDVILMDVDMPGMDGLEATRRLAEQNPEVRVLIYSQHDDREHLFRCIKTGCAGYLPKKAEGSELISAIRTVNRGDSFLYPSAAAALMKDYREQTRNSDAYDKLTPREREIFRLTAKGHTGKEIADMLFISIKTIMGHRTKIIKKLGLRNRSELIQYAMKKGLLSI